MKHEIEGGAEEPEDEHQAALADEPFLHAALGAGQGVVQAVTAFCRDQGEKPGVSVIALQNEIDGKDEAHGHVYQLSCPVFDGEQKVGGRVAGKVLKAGADFFGVEVVGEGDASEPVKEPRQAGGHFPAELLQIADDGGESKEAEGGKGGSQEQEKEENGIALEGAPASDAQPSGELDHWSEHNGEESTHVYQHEYFANQPRQGTGQGEGEGEDDIAAKTAGVGDLLGHGGSCAARSAFREGYSIGLVDADSWNPGLKSETLRQAQGRLWGTRH